VTALVLEQWRPAEETPQEDQGCGEPGDQWGEVNRYFNQSPIYLQSGQAVHANSPKPGMWRVCITGGLAEQIATSGGHVDVDITFTKQKAWEDPGQLPYSVTNMNFFADLSKYMDKGQLAAVKPGDLLAGSANSDSYTSLVIADDPFPGYTEEVSGGSAQTGQVHEPPTAAAATVPCAWPTNPVLPPTCVANYEFDVDPTSNNQQLVVRLTTPSAPANDWDLYLQRQSKRTGGWFTVAQSATGSASEEVTILTPPGGHYRAHRQLGGDGASVEARDRLLQRVRRPAARAEYADARPAAVLGEQAARLRRAWREPRAHRRRDPQPRVHGRRPSLDDQHLQRLRRQRRLHERRHHRYVRRSARRQRQPAGCRRGRGPQAPDV
jgi:hypothetical protein